MATDKTFMEDRESLAALVDCLSPDLKAEYASYMALSLEAVFPGRKLVVYKLVGGKPLDIEVLTIGQLRMSAQSGPTAELSSDRHSQDQTVGMVPMKLLDREVFLHLPQKFEFKWKGKRTPRNGVNFAPHYAVLIKTRNKPHLAVDGGTYCVRLNEFREMFPDLKVGY